MNAMHCLRIPHGPAGGPDRPVFSHSPRRNPLLLRHLAFPKGGARVAAARRLTVCAQAPAPSQPEGEDAYPKVRPGGWHRTRGAAVGAAVVLACALGAAFLSRGRGAYCCTQDPSNNPPTFAGGGSLTVVEQSMGALSSILVKKKGVAPKEPPMLLQHVMDQISYEVGFFDPKLEKLRLLRFLLEHLSDELVKEDYSRFKAFCREQGTTDSLYEEWSQRDGDRKYSLGLLLMEIFINQRNFKKALTICEQEVKLGPPADARPTLYLAIIKMMLAVERMLEPETTKKELEDTIQEAKEAWLNFRGTYQIYGKIPQETKDDLTAKKHP